MDMNSNLSAETQDNFEKKGWNTPEWIAKSKAVKERDGNKCRCCGTTTKILHAHHRCYITKNGVQNNPWEYPNELLITLCEDCHRNGHKVHGKVPVYHF
ncbi:MAG: hypothetical protein QM528_06400 [Phycisphaerales bacterium]|nr:hypothetical protein [Phycisphaerales bacterium]